VRVLDPRLLRTARSARRLLAADVAAGVVTALVVVAQAALLAHVVARAVAGAAVAEVAPALVALAAAFAVRGALAWGFEVAGRRAAATVLSELRLALVGRRLSAQPAALDGTEAGEVAAAAVQGAERLEAYFARCLPQVVLACLVPPVVLVAVGVADVASAVIMAATLPLVPVFMWLIGRHAERQTEERWHALRLLSVRFLDAVRGLPTLRTFNRGRAEAAALADAGERYRRATMETLRVAFLSGSVLELAATLGVAIVAVEVGVRLAGGGLGLEAGLFVLVLAPELYLPLRRLGAEYHASADGLAVAGRILELLEAPAEAPPGGARVPPSPAAATVRLEGVSFCYPGRAAHVLDDVSLELAPGETVALTGDSGAGKSTLAGLLLLLYRPTVGRITVGGVDLATCRPEAWRRHVAWVPQHPTLLPGTVADNIRMGVPGASAATVREAARMAGAHRFAAALPAGYDTPVGAAGRPLSTGERRRIALARAFLRDAPLVILDEPTADLDDASAEVVAAAVERLRARRTVLLIVHRPELAARADRVVRLAPARPAAAPALTPA
jgi:thiol reductant ABC exporter CydD subunit